MKLKLLVLTGVLMVCSQFAHAQVENMPASMLPDSVIMQMPTEPGIKSRLVRVDEGLFLIKTNNGQIVEASLLDVPNNAVDYSADQATNELPSPPENGNGATTQTTVYENTTHRYIVVSTYFYNNSELVDIKSKVNTLALR